MVANVEGGRAADEPGLARGDLVRTFGSGDTIAMLVRRDCGTFYTVLGVP